MGNLCISPASVDWVAYQMENEAAVANERRRAREERALRAPCRAPRTRAWAGPPSTPLLLESLVRYARGPSGPA
eukprot:7590447-Pyramimonas_sp.AAC.1